MKLPKFDSCTISHSSTLRVHLLILVGITTLLNILLVWIYRDGSIVITAENGLLENIQLLLLALVFLSVAVIGFRFRKSSFKFVLCGIGLLSISLFLQELDLRRTNLDHWVIFITSDQGRIWLTALLWLPFLWFFIRNKYKFLKFIPIYLKTNSFRLMLLAGISLFIGAAFDKNILATQDNYFLEEIFELDGYAIFLLATLSTDSFFKKYSDR